MSERRAGAKGRRMGSSRRKLLREGSAEAPAAAPSSGQESPWASEMMQKVQDFLRERDKDQAGFITRSDMEKLQEENLPCSREEMELVFDGLDAAGTGRLSTEEFTAGLWQFLSSQKTARHHRRSKMASRRVRLVIPSPVLEGADSEEQRHFAAFMEQLGTDNVSEEQEIWQLWVKLRQDEPQLLGNLEDFLAKMRHRIQEAKSRKEALELTLNKRVAEHNKEVQQLCEALEQQIQQEQQRLQQESLARSQQQDLELQQALGASEREVQRLVTAQEELETRCRSLRSTQQATSTENQQLEESNRLLEEQLQHLHQQLQDTQERLQTARAAVAQGHVEEPRYRVVAELPSKTPLSPQASLEKSEVYHSKMRVRLGSQGTKTKTKSIHQVVWEMPPAEVSSLGPQPRAGSTEEDPFPEFLKEEHFSDQSSLLREMNDAIAALNKQLKPQALDAPPVLAEAAQKPWNDAEPQMGPEAATGHGTPPGVRQETLSSHIGYEMFEGDLKEGPATAELPAPDVTQAGASMGAGHPRAQQLGAEQGETLEEAWGMIFLQGKGSGVKEPMPRAAEDPQGAQGESREAEEWVLLEGEGEGWMQGKTGWEETWLLGEAKEAALSQGENLEVGLGPPEAGEAGLAAGRQLGLAAPPEECVQPPGAGLGEEAGPVSELPQEHEIQPGERLQPEPPAQEDAAPEVTVAAGLGMLEEEHVSVELQGDTLDAKMLPAQQGGSRGAGGEEGEVEVTQPGEAELQPQAESAKGEAAQGGSVGAEVLEEDGNQDLGLAEAAGAAVVCAEGPSPVQTPVGSPDLGGMLPVKAQALELVGAEDAQADTQLPGGASPETPLSREGPAAMELVEEAEDGEEGQGECELLHEAELDPQGEEPGLDVLPREEAVIQAVLGDQSADVNGQESLEAEKLKVTLGGGTEGDLQPPSEAGYLDTEQGGSETPDVQPLEQLDVPEVAEKQEAEDAQEDKQLPGRPGPETLQGRGDHAALQLVEEAEDGARGQGECELLLEPELDPQGERAPEGVQPREEAENLAVLGAQSADANVSLVLEVDELKSTLGGGTERDLQPPSEAGYLDTEQGVREAPDVQPLDQLDTPELLEMREAEDSGQGEDELLHEPELDPQGEGVSQGVQPWEEAVIQAVLGDQSTDVNVLPLLEVDELESTPGGGTGSDLLLPREAGYLDTEQGGSVAPGVQQLEEGGNQDLGLAEAAGAAVVCAEGPSPVPTPVGSPDLGGMLPVKAQALELVGAEDAQADTQLPGGASPETPHAEGDPTALQLKVKGEGRGQGGHEVPQEPLMVLHGAGLRQGDESGAEEQPGAQADEFSTGRGGPAPLPLMTFGVQRAGVEGGGDVEHPEEDGQLELVQGEGSKQDGLFLAESQGLELAEAEDAQADTQLPGGASPETPLAGEGPAALQLVEEAEDGEEGQGECELLPQAELNPQEEGPGLDVQPWEEAVIQAVLGDQSTDVNVQESLEAEKLKVTLGGGTEGDLQPPSEAGYLDTEQGVSVTPDVQPLDHLDTPEVSEKQEAEDAQEDKQLPGRPGPETLQGRGDHAALQLVEEAEDGARGQGECELLLEPELDPQGERAPEGVQPWEEAENLAVLGDQSAVANVPPLLEMDELKSMPGGETGAAVQLCKEQGGSEALDVQPLEQLDTPEVVEMREAEDSGQGEDELLHEPVLNPQGEGPGLDVQPWEEAVIQAVLGDQSTDANVLPLLEVDELKSTPGEGTEAALQLCTEQGGTVAPDVQPLDLLDTPESVEKGEAEDAQADTQLPGGASPETPLAGEGPATMELVVGAEDGEEGQGEDELLHEPELDPQGERAPEVVQPWEEAVIQAVLGDQSADVNVQESLEAEKLKVTLGGGTERDLQPPSEAGYLDTEQGMRDAPDVQPLDHLDTPEVSEKQEAEDSGHGEDELLHEPELDPQGEGLSQGVQPWEEAVIQGMWGDQSTDANVPPLLEVDELESTPGGGTGSDLLLPREAGYLDTEQGGSVAPGVQQLEEDGNQDLGLAEAAGAAVVCAEGPSPVQTPVGSPDLGGMLPVKAQALELVGAEESQADTQLPGGASPEAPLAGEGPAAMELVEEAEDEEGQGEDELLHEPVIDPQGEEPGLDVLPREEAVIQAVLGDQSADVNVQETVEAEKLKVTLGGGTERDLQPPSEAGYLDTEQEGSVTPDVQPLDHLDTPEVAEKQEAEDAQEDKQLPGRPGPETLQGRGDHAALQLVEEAEDGARGQGECELLLEPELDPQGERAPEGVQPWEEAENLAVLGDQSAVANVPPLLEMDELKSMPGGETGAAVQLCKEQGGSEALDVQPLEQLDTPEVVEMREAEDSGQGECELLHEPVLNPQGEGPGLDVQPWEEAVIQAVLGDQSTDVNVQETVEAEKLKVTLGGGTEGDLQPPSEAGYLDTEQEGSVTPDVHPLEQLDTPEVSEKQEAEDSGQGEDELLHEPVLNPQGERAPEVVQPWEEAVIQAVLGDQSTDANVLPLFEVDELKSTPGEGTEAALQLCTEQGGTVAPDVQPLDLLDTAESVEKGEAEDAQADTQLPGGASPETPLSREVPAAMQLVEEAEDGEEGQGEDELLHEPELDPQEEGPGLDVQPREEAVIQAVLGDQSADVNVQETLEAEKLKVTLGGGTEGDLQPPSEAGYLDTEQGVREAPDVQPLDQLDAPELLEMREAEDSGQGECELLHEPELDPQGEGVSQGVQPWEEAVIQAVLGDQSTDANVLPLLEVDELKSTPGGGTGSDLLLPREAGYLDTEQGGSVAPGVQQLEEDGNQDLGLAEAAGAAVVCAEGPSPVPTPVGSPDLGGMLPVKAQALELVGAEDAQADTQLPGGASPEAPLVGEGPAVMELVEEAEDGEEGQGEDELLHEPELDPQGEEPGLDVQPREEAVIQAVLGDQSADVNVQETLEAEKLKVTLGGGTEADLQPPSEAGYLDTEQGVREAPDVQPLEQLDTPEVVEMREAEDSGQGEDELLHEPEPDPQGEGLSQGVQPWEEAVIQGMWGDQSTDANVPPLLEVDELESTPGGGTGSDLLLPREAGYLDTEQGGSVAPGVQQLEEDGNQDLGLAEAAGAAVVCAEGPSPVQTPVGSPDLGGMLPVKAQALELVGAEESQADTQLPGGASPEAPLAGEGPAAMELVEEAEDEEGQGEDELLHEPVIDPQGEEPGLDVLPREEAVIQAVLGDQSADVNVQETVEAEKLKVTLGGGTERDLQPPSEAGYLDTEQGGSETPDVQPLDHLDTPEVSEKQEAEDSGQGEDELLHEPVLNPQGERAPEVVQPWEEAVIQAVLGDQSTDANVLPVFEVDELKSTPGEGTEAALQLCTEQGGTVAPDVQPLDPLDTPESVEKGEAEDAQADTQLPGGASPETPLAGEGPAAMQLVEEAEDGEEGQGEDELLHEPELNPQGEEPGLDVQPREEAVIQAVLGDQSADVNGQETLEAEKLKVTLGGGTEGDLQPPSEAGYLDTEQGVREAPDVQPLDQLDAPELLEMREAEDSGQGEDELLHEPELDPQGEGLSQGVQPWEEAVIQGMWGDQSTDANVPPLLEVDELESTPGGGTGSDLLLPREAGYLDTEQGGSVAPGVQQLEEDGNQDLGLAEAAGAAVVCAEGPSPVQTPVGSPDLGGMLPVKAQALELAEAEDAQADTQLPGGASPEAPLVGEGPAVMELVEEAEDGEEGHGECELLHEAVIDPQGEEPGLDVQPWEEAVIQAVLGDQSADVNGQETLEAEKLKVTLGGGTEADLQPPSEAGYLDTEQGGSVTPDVQPLDHLDTPEVSEKQEAEDSGQGEDELLHEPVLNPQGERAPEVVQPWEEAVIQAVLGDQSTDANVLPLLEVDELKSTAGEGTEAALQLCTEQGGTVAPDVQPLDPLDTAESVEKGEAEDAQADTQLPGGASPETPLAGEGPAVMQLVEEAEDGADLAPQGPAGMQEGEQSQTPGLEAGLCAAHTTDVWEGAAGAHVCPPPEATLHPEGAAEGPAVNMMLGTLTGADVQIPEDAQTLEIPQGEGNDAEDRPLDAARALEAEQGGRLEAGARSLVGTQPPGMKHGHDDDDGLPVLAPPLSQGPSQISTLQLQTMMQEDVLVPDAWQLGGSGQAAPSELQEQVSAQRDQVKLHTAPQQPEKPPHGMGREQGAARPAEPPKQEVPPASTPHTRVQQEDGAENDQLGMGLRSSSLRDAAVISVQPQRQLVGEQSKAPHPGLQEQQQQEAGRKMSQEGGRSPGGPGPVTAAGAEALLDPDHLYNVLFVGDSHVGKTSFLYRLHADAFNPHLTATVGLDYQVKSLVVDNKCFSLRLWDSAGQERYRSITKQYFRKADGVVLMYDITSEYSFSDVRYWLTCIQEGAEDGVGILLLGNKTDRAAERRVPTEEGERLAKEHQLMFYECSAASGHNVSESMVSFIRLLKAHEDGLKNKVVEEPRPPQKKGCC